MTNVDVHLRPAIPQTSHSARQLMMSYAAPPVAAFALGGLGSLPWLKNVQYNLAALHSSNGCIGRRPISRCTGAVRVPETVTVAAVDVDVGLRQELDTDVDHFESHLDEMDVAIECDNGHSDKDSRRASPVRLRYVRSGCNFGLCTT